MAINQTARANHDRLFGPPDPGRPPTDPDLLGYFDNFAWGEVWEHGSLEDHTRLLVLLAAQIGCQARDEYRLLLEVALDNGVSPGEAKEVVYHAVAYLGMSRTLEFGAITNEVLTARGVELPLPPQSTTTPQTRFEKGWTAQAAIVGEERLRSMHADAPADEQHIQRWLTENCFGDTYTRTGIDLQTRELLTFVLLVAQGGCDPQVRGHVSGNLNVGNGRQVLLDTLSQLVPFIGYPRTLNGLRAVDEVAPFPDAAGSLDPSSSHT
jgi:4-carboxymuconolactone decarboxylase